MRYSAHLALAFADLRRLRGMTCAQVAKDAQCSLRTITGLESGRIPQHRNIEHIAAALGMPLWRIHKRAERSHARNGKQEVAGPRSVIGYPHAGTKVPTATVRGGKDVRNAGTR